MENSMDKTALNDTTTIAHLKKIVLEFSQEREWQQFHTPKNVSMALAGEASELMEHFLWVESKDSYTTAAEKKESVEQEVADVFCYLLTFCNQTGIDLAAALEKKMEINRIKYPVSKSKGKSTKYTDL